ncbi:unnamed protein product, partial [Tenebrio molitor]
CRQFRIAGPISGGFLFIKRSVITCSRCAHGQESSNGITAPLQSLTTESVELGRRRDAQTRSVHIRVASSRVSRQNTLPVPGNNFTIKLAVRTL